MGLLRIGGFGFGVLINEILELELRGLRETNGRAEKLQEMRVVLAKLVGKVVRVGFLCALRMKVSNCSADMGGFADDMERFRGNMGRGKINSR